MASQTKRKRIDSVDSAEATQSDLATLRTATNGDNLPVPVNSRDELRNLNPYIYVYDCHQFEEYDFPHNKFFGSLHERMSVNLESGFIPFEFKVCSSVISFSDLADTNSEVYRGIEVRAHHQGQRL
jgi:hypothetical protein